MIATGLVGTFTATGLVGTATATGLVWYCYCYGFGLVLLRVWFGTATATGLVSTTVVSFLGFLSSQVENFS